MHNDRKHTYKHECSHDDSNHSVKNELIHHLPYAIFSVSFALLILSFFSALATGNGLILKSGAKGLFHAFHYMHIVFAATGTVITFCRFSKNYLQALAVGLISPTFFCILSDAVLPYIGGKLLGVHMHFHACFLKEPFQVLPFLFVGIINGFVMSKHHEDMQGGYSLRSHAIHIMVSSLASTFYLIAHGFSNWHDSIGNVFLLLIIAVVVPCTLADVVVPMTMARVGCKDEEKHSS